MLDSGIFSSGLKISKIFPIFKDGDVNSLNNYRIISLLPTISKIFERIIYNQLYAYLDNNNIYLKNGIDSAQSIRLSWQQ